MDARLAKMEKQLDWLCPAVDATAKTVKQLSDMFNFIMNGLMNSPFGAVIRKEMEKTNV